MRNRLLYDWMGFLDGDQRVPVLIESFEPNADFTRWALTVREGAVFHDGSPVTADDVLFSLRAMGDPEIGGGLLSAAAADLDLKRSRARDPRTLELRTTRPLADVDVQLLGGQICVVKAGTKEYTIDKAVGSGAYTLEALTLGQSASLRRVEDYWGVGVLGDGPYLDEIEVFNVPEPDARMNALLGGQAEYAMWLDYAGAKANASNTAIKLADTGEVYGQAMNFSMNARIKPFDDPDVRQAFKLACDREALVQGALLGYGQVANDDWGFGSIDYHGDQLPKREHDPEQARSLLERAGAIGAEIEIAAYPGTGTGAAAQLFAEQLRQVGVKARSRVIDPPELFENAPTFDNIQVLAVATAGNQPFSTTTGPRTLMSTAGFNTAGWNDKDWDRRLFEARALATGSQERADAMTQLQRDVWDHSGWIMWGRATILNAGNPGVEGMEPAGIANAPSLHNAWRQA